MKTEKTLELTFEEFLTQDFKNVFRTVVNTVLKKVTVFIGDTENNDTEIIPVTKEVIRLLDTPFRNYQLVLTITKSRVNLVILGNLFIPLNTLQTQTLTCRTLRVRKITVPRKQILKFLNILESLIIQGKNLYSTIEIKMDTKRRTFLKDVSRELRNILHLIFQFPQVHKIDFLPNENLIVVYLLETNDSINKVDYVIHHLYWSYQKFKRICGYFQREVIAKVTCVKKKFFVEIPITELPNIEPVMNKFDIVERTDEIVVLEI